MMIISFNGFIKAYMFCGTPMYVDFKVKIFVPLKLICKIIFIYGIKVLYAATNIESNSSAIYNECTCV